MRIVVCKSARTLWVWRHGECLLRTRIFLGRAADAGPKSREGDGRTPEGDYYICTKNARSRYHLSLGISYPSPKDAAGGAVSPDALETIRDAWAQGLRPPWDTPLGGYIMLHGAHPQGKTGDWTEGCVALSDPEMDRLFQLAEIGTPVTILP